MREWLSWESSSSWMMSIGSVSKNDDDGDGDGDGDDDGLLERCIMTSSGAVVDL